MKISVYYEDRYNPTILEVPDEDCEIWVETDYQQRLAESDDKTSVTRRTPQQIMDEECNKPTFNNEHSETRRHVSLDALDADGCYLTGADDVEYDFNEDEYADLYEAISKLRPQQKELLRKVFWEDLKHIDVAKSEGVSGHVIDARMYRIYETLKKRMTSKNNQKKP